jgi:hypothetical protein
MAEPRVVLGAMLLVPMTIRSIRDRDNVSLVFEGDVCRQWVQLPAKDLEAHSIRADLVRAALKQNKELLEENAKLQEKLDILSPGWDDAGRQIVSLPDVPEVE